MSLRLWLPLNGTLENKGLDTVTITNYSATIDNSGKIGKCYSFDGSNSRITINNFSLGNKWSYACWFYADISTTRGWESLVVFNTNASTDVQLGFYIYVKENRMQSTANGQYNSMIPITYGQWNHLLATFDGTNLKTYINGTLANTKTITATAISATNLTIGGRSASSSGAGTSMQLPLLGKINDVRIYDNILSEKEIKEIAKGLVLHLPLNNNGLGNKNILFNSKESFNVIPAANVNVTARSRSLIEDNTCPIGGKVASFTIGANGTTSSGCYYNMTQMGINPASSYLTSNATYTLSFYGKSSVTAYLWAAALVESQTLIKYTPISDKGAYIKLTSNWQKYTVTFQWTSTSKMTVCFYAYPNTSEVTFNIAGLKLEEGSIATPWSPNPADENYPASGSGISENLFIATDMSESITTCDSTDWTKHFRMYNGYAAIHTIDTTEMTDTIALTTANRNLGIAFARLNSEINLDPNEYYTISCEAKCTNADLKLCIGLSYYNDQSAWVWRGGSNAKSFTTADTWQKITHTFKPDANTYAIFYCFTINPGASPTGTDTFSIRKCKLEKGSTATEWQPSPVDDSYKTLGYYNNISFDQSGYNHNAVKHGVLSLLSDSPKYNVSTHISDNTHYIKIDGLSTLGFANSYSFAWWGKPNGTAYMQWGFGDGIRLNGMYTGVLWNTGDGSNNPLYKIGTTTQVTAPSLNTWHHYVMTGNGTKCYVYLDGELWAEAKTYKSISGTTIYINGWNDTSQYSSNNFSIQDFRIYATALSEDDVKSLYNNNAYIDSNGKIYGKIRW